MNDLVKFAGGLPANPEDLEAGLKNLQQNVQGGDAGVPYIRLLKSGVYAYGQENIEPEEGSEWAVNPYSLMHGFSCWGDGELLDERMVPFTQAPPNRAELPDYGHDWNQQVAFHMQCLNGEDEGLTVLYKGTSTGLRNATKQLINELISQLQVDKSNIVPVLDLQVDSYHHKKYGEIFIPVFEVTRFIPIDEAPEAEAAAEEPEAATAKADDSPEPEAAKPRRRRRRAAAEAPEEPAKGGTNKRRRRRAS